MIRAFVLSGMLIAGTVAHAPVAGANDKITICHIPPGNPENAHTITIDVSSLPAHEAHGDYVGGCGDGGPGDGGFTPL